MLFQFRHAAAAILVLAGTGAAGAQTVITTQPVETVVTPAPLQLTPAQRTVIYRTIVRRSRVRRPVVRERVVTESVRPAVTERRVVVRGPVAPTVGERVVTESVSPTVTERRVVVQEPVAPTVGESVVVPAPTYVAPPADYAYVEEPAYVPAPPAYVPAPRETYVDYTYAVGTRVPAAIQLSTFPRTVLARAPALRPYRYFVYGDRVLLVDPVTSTIVADVTQ